MHSIGFLGGGRMASAIADGLLESNEAISLAVCDPCLSNESWGQRRAKVLSIEDLFSSCEWLVLAVKPQIFAKERANWSTIPFKGKGVISVMAGVKSKTIESVFSGLPLIRTMPNTPMMFKQGMVALAKGTFATAEHLAEVEAFFSPVAKTLCVQEHQLDGVTAISGSGPAYLFRLAEEVLLKSADLGLAQNDAKALWAQTLRGAAAMLEGDTSPQVLREQVTSPGGTTQAALETFERMGMLDAFGAGLQAAFDRSLELG